MHTLAPAHRCLEYGRYVPLSEGIVLVPALVTSITALGLLQAYGRATAPVEYNRSHQTHKLK